MTRPLVLRSFLGFLIASTAAAAGAEDKRGEFLKAALGARSSGRGRRWRTPPITSSRTSPACPR